MIRALSDLSLEKCFLSGPGLFHQILCLPKSFCVSTKHCSMILVGKATDLIGKLTDYQRGRKDVNIILILSK